MRLKYIPLCLLIMTAACSNPETRVDTDIALPVSVEEIVLKPIEEFITTTGTVNATQNIEMRSETVGFYRLAINPKTSKPFALGDAVTEGQVIIYLDNPEQENSIRFDSLELEVEISNSEYEKQKSLYDLGGVTLRELKNAEIASINSKYSYDNALIQLAKMKIVAPFDGIVVDLTYYTQGVKVDSGSDMVHIMDYNNLNMDINLPGKLLGQIKEDQPVRTMNYTISDKFLTGKIAHVSPVLDPETRTFKASVEIDNPELLLRPGMFVNTEVIVASNDSTIVIAKDLIIPRRNRKVVFVVEQGTAIERVVITGLENPEEIEVIEGLELNERLVIEGYETLRNRAKVTIVQ
ncbi:efflux RND transporter periplasmic adaptor subunit [Candidatus Latescibacterota bacterium]